MSNPGLSVIVPFLNEEEGIWTFCETLDSFSVTLDYPLELVFVDDGSTDATVERLKDYTFRHIPDVRLIRLSHNFGSHAAIRAGISQAKYEYCTWLGSDLQEPLELLTEGYRKLREGNNVVYVEKKTIQVSKANRAFSRVYSYLMRKFAVKNYSSGGISTILFDGHIKELLNRNIESNSSIMLQIMDAGFQSCTISLDFHERKTGVSKWTVSKKIKLFIDSFVAFSFMPIRLVSLVGIFLFGLGLIVGIIALIRSIIQGSGVGSYSLLIGIISIGFGITNISLGIIAEYLWRAYDAARKRPTFIIADNTVLAGEKAET